MIVDLEDKEEAGSFEIKGGGKVHLRLLGSKDLKEMKAACFTNVVEYPLLDGKYQRFEARKFDEDLWEEMRWDKGIIGWDSIFDRNGQAIPVTKENKLLLIQKVTDFRDAVEAGFKLLREADKQKAEGQEKNS